MVEIHREPQSTLPSPGQKQQNPQATRPVEWVQATTPPAEAHPPRGDGHPATFRAPPTPRGPRRGGSYVQPRRPGRARVSAENSLAVSGQTPSPLASLLRTATATSQTPRSAPPDTLGSPPRTPIAPPHPRFLPQPPGSRRAP